MVVGGVSIGAAAARSFVTVMRGQSHANASSGTLLAPTVMSYIVAQERNATKIYTRAIHWVFCTVEAGYMYTETRLSVALSGGEIFVLEVKLGGLDHLDLTNCSVTDHARSSNTRTPLASGLGSLRVSTIITNRR